MHSAVITAELSTVKSFLKSYKSTKHQTLTCVDISDVKLGKDIRTTLTYHAYTIDTHFRAVFGTFSSVDDFIFEPIEAGTRWVLCSVVYLTVEFTLVRGD